MGRAGNDQKAQDLERGVDSTKRVHIANAASATVVMNSALDELGLEYAEGVRSLAALCIATADCFAKERPALEQGSVCVEKAVAAEREVSAASNAELRKRHEQITKDIASSNSTYVAAEDAAGAADWSSAQTTEGYLLKQSKSSVMKLWARRYFAVRDGALVHYKDGGDGQLRVTEGVPLVLTTTKPRPDIRRFCFELVAPQKQFVLQAESAAAYLRWTKVIDNVRAAALEAGPVHEAARKALDPCGPGAALEAIWALDPANRACCDCGAPDPEWVSINLGALCCLKCSGAHRALGVGVSKVRSLSLDSFDPVTLLVVAALGNRRVNAVYAPSLPLDPAKCSNDINEFVHAKYVQKLYVANDPTLTSTAVAGGGCDGDDEENCGGGGGGGGNNSTGTFAHACRKEDLPAMLYFLAHGADVDTPRRPGSSETLLHYATRKGLPLAAAFLMLNGADTDRAGNGGNRPLHYAAASNMVETVALLLHAGAKADPKNDEGKTPLNIALECEHSDCCTLLRLYAMYRDSDTLEARESDQLSIRDIENSYNITMVEKKGGICAMLEAAYERSEALKRRREKSKVNKKKADSDSAEQHPAPDNNNGNENENENGNENDGNDDKGHSDDPSNTADSSSVQGPEGEERDKGTDADSQ